MIMSILGISDELNDIKTQMGTFAKLLEKSNDEFRNIDMAKIFDGFAAHIDHINDCVSMHVLAERDRAAREQGKQGVYRVVPLEEKKAARGNK